MSDQSITIHIDGHEGHRGNVLAYAFLDRFRAFLEALSHAERVYIGSGYRKSDYEIVDAAKINPTQMTLKPFTRTDGYNPLLAFNWTWEQLNRVADGGDVDDRVDASLAKRFADIVPSSKDTGLRRVWLTRGVGRVDLDSAFRAKSETIASLKTMVIERPRWKHGKSRGSVTGKLLQVDDIDGNHSLAIIPPVGSGPVQCSFRDEHKEKIKLYLFKTVKVEGDLTYSADSPFPTHVEMFDIGELATSEHLLDMRGMFHGRERDSDDMEQMFHGL